MFIWRNILKRRFRAINWFIASALLFVALAPFHFHFHLQQAHSDLSSAAVDLHMAADLAQEEHHDTAVVMKTVPDALSQIADDYSLPPAILSVFLLILPIVVCVYTGIFRETRSQPISRSYFINPPLRAPPRT